ncbi:hypothetical protein GEV33_003152 [Tenebrio molitor]|uniref:Uncharacterized protein n=1 Tax=Tenebrio molitor TaxID=7067 RepID=A0A8J6LEB0_TENMO|nr:hypothetical protein GEV33_003152 [Tenebrio molitor]
MGRKVPEEGGRRVAVLMVVTKQVPLVFPFPALYKSILIKGLFDDFIWCLKIYGRFVDELKLIEAVGEERMDLPGLADGHLRRSRLRQSGEQSEGWSLGVGPSGSPEGVAQHPVLISRAVYAG